ncbi:ChbG/HpnK family deacetylase [Endozoicomonas sp. 8E]|uniref:ChbG/HpnK family deacetylase n=1 Tax=Endozoicomonas sp. 8E TaxID=3035692 RepID=UPI0029390D09|nr:ChbG/HpnK family deacetylase [Endozoicomonas sp. 8E]WOG26468.1 ChbG/HpnK family deacetylase [Endozoicomonas sp. 8E]
MKRITLCADDYGIHTGVSEAILELAILGRIQATSCLVTGPDWIKQANNLTTIQEKIDIGLHLNLTEGKGLSSAYVDGLPSLNQVLIKSHLHLLDRTALLEEVTAQYQYFVDATGKAPDFVDGHQHVHHLPMIREALLSVIRAFRPEPSFWVRSVTPIIRHGGGLKSYIIEGSGSKSLTCELINQSINTNTSFAGVYSLKPKENYSTLMKAWLSDSYDKGLIMCHPGKTADHINLDHPQARQLEFDYLSSQRFLDDCHQTGVDLCRMKQ